MSHDLTSVKVAALVADSQSLLGSFLVAWLARFLARDLAE
jgi:hypothetical protein